MLSVRVLLILVAIVCELLAAVGVSSRVGLVPLGLACFFAAAIV